MVYVSTPNVTK